MHVQILLYHTAQHIRMEKSETVRERVLNAVNAGMRHTDSVAIFADSSEAFVRRVLNELADEGEIQKIAGRAHHTYLPKEEEERSDAR